MKREQSGAMSRPIRYVVGHGWAERVGDTTALPHRVLTIDEHGDVEVRKRSPFGDETPHLQISAAELQLLAREARRERARLLWARLGTR